jgi:hypothetical protein
MSFDYSRFYVLEEAFEPRALRVASVDEIAAPEALTRAESIPDEPIRFRRDEGGRRLDLVGTTEAVLNLVSDRVIATLRDSSFTGWTTYPIEIREWNGEIVPGYQGLAVTGRSGALDKSLSRVEVLPPYVPSGRAMPHRIGLLFPPETWDGSDIFVPEETTGVMVTAAVRDAIQALGATNMGFGRIDQVALHVLDEESEPLG